MEKFVTLFIELIAFITCLTIAYMWAQDPGGNYEPWFVISSFALVGCEIFRKYKIYFVKREGRTFTPGELVRHSENLRRKFQEEIHKCKAEQLRKDAIIRHVNRLDKYPEVDGNQKGISPWFRVGLLDVYHKGIMVGLRFGSLTKCENGYKYTDYKGGETGDVKVYQIGKIPYEFIEEVNVDGDEYYNYPHIFCHFANKSEPYEKLVYCEEVNMGNGHSYFKEIASFEDVKRNSIGTNDRNFG